MALNQIRAAALSLFVSMFVVLREQMQEPKTNIVHALPITSLVNSVLNGTSCHRVITVIQTAP